jgi:hypothetical protein
MMMPSTYMRVRRVASIGAVVARVSIENMPTAHPSMKSNFCNAALQVR